MRFNRVQKGVPTGGQFRAMEHSEGEVRLGLGAKKMEPDLVRPADNSRGLGQVIEDAGDAIFEAGDALSEASSAFVARQRSMPAAEEKGTFVNWRDMVPGFIRRRVPRRRSASSLKAEAKFTSDVHRQSGGQLEARRALFPMEGVKDYWTFELTYARPPKFLFVVAPENGELFTYMGTNIHGTREPRPGEAVPVNYLALPEQDRMPLNEEVVIAAVKESREIATRHDNWKIADDADLGRIIHARVVEDLRP